MPEEKPKKKTKKYDRGFSEQWKDSQSSLAKSWGDKFSSLLNSLGLSGAAGNIGRSIWSGMRSIAGALGLSIGWLVRAVQQGIMYLWRFDWNVSDQEIDQQIQADLNAFAGILGGAFGASIGWFIGGSVGGGVVAKIDPAMGMAIAKELGEEAWEEVSQYWLGAMYVAVDIAASNAFRWAFKHVRRFIKNQKWARQLFGERYSDLMDNWGKPGGEVVALNKWKNDRIESIPNEAVRNFVEEFFEEFGDATSEVVAVIAQGIDSYNALQSTVAKEQTLGRDMLVRVTPNKEEGEEFRFYGREHMIRPQVTSFLAQYQMMYGKDIGQYVGEPAPQYQMKKVHTISAVILWQSKITRPFRVKGEKFKVSTLTIPDLKKTGITWRGLQKAAGGYQGFVSGPSRFWCKLECGAQTTLWAESEEVAERIVKNLMGFSASKIIAESEGTQKKTHRQNSANRNYKEKIRVYPYSVTFFRTGADRSGRVRLFDTRDEKVTRRSLKIGLWQKLDNPQFDKAIDEFLTAAFADIPREFQ